MSTQIKLPYTEKDVSIEQITMKQYRNIINYVSSDESDIERIKGLKTTLAEVTHGADIDSLPIVDIIFLYLQVSKISMYPTLSGVVRVDCEECKTENGTAGDFILPIKDIKYVPSDVDSTIKFGDNQFIKMCEPPLNKIIKSHELREKLGDELDEELFYIACHIESYGNEEQTTDASDIVEVYEWFSNLPFNKELMDKCGNFVENTPTLKTKLPTVCQSCNTKKDIHYEGVVDFLV